MEYGKFIISGEDKKALASIKNALAANGHIYVGYLKETANVLRYVRNCTPDLLIIDIGINFKAVKPVLEIIDEDMLAACLLILDSRNEEIIEFVRCSKVINYLIKPALDDSVLQVTDLSLINYRRMLDYEQKVRKLNETLESRKIIEKAKWILVEKEGYTEAEAYEVINKKSRDNRIPMRNIAEAIIMTKG